MTPYYERGEITIYRGRAEDVLPTLPDSSVDLVLTDPPFNAGLAYGDHFTDEMPWPVYTAWLGGVIDECERISTGMVMVFLSVPAAIHLIAQRPPAWMGSWVKPSPRNRHAGATPFQPQWEPCLIYGRTYDGAGYATYGLPDVWQARPVVQNGHPCPKPEELIRRILTRIPAETVLDPFMGSGTILAVAKQLGRRAIGIEPQECFCEIAARRLSQEILPLEAAS